jgi:SPP1 gp7 family putative phage head morphogenesis protein
MNDLVRFATSVEFATGRKRGRHPVFSSRQFYPYEAERRLRIALRNELEDYIGAAYGAAIFNESFKNDSLEELTLLSEGLSDDFKAEISYAAESIARKVSSSIAEMTEMTVGKPYYPQSAKESLLKDWESNFQVLCVSAESDAKKDIARLVTQAKNEGWNGKQLEKAVMKELPDKYANRASLIARTESAKLNTSVTLETYKEIGCKYYMWMATLDERVRPDHAVMNGLICSATDPTVWYEENPDDPMHPIEHKRDDTMVHLHPGDDFQCRCTMVMWDPVIDGKYEVKEAPEEEEPKEPEQKPESDPKSEELEKAKNETAKAVKRAEKAEEKLNAEQRRREILQNANERHAKRTVADREKIQAKWTLSHPHSQMPDKFKTVDDIATFWNKLDKSREVLGKERILKNGDFRYDGVDRKNNGSTMMDGSIKLNSKIGKDCVNAFEKIRLRENLTEDEATSMATLWHEITHNRHKRTSWIELSTNAKETKYMEMANELVARNTLEEFYKMLGLKENPFKSLEKFRNNTSYNPWVVGLQSASEMFGIDRKVFVGEVADSLFNKAYNNQRISLSQVFLNNVKDLKENEAKKIVDYCIGIKGYKFENGLFITRDYVDIGTEIYNNVIAGIQESIKKRKKKK